MQSAIEYLTTYGWAFLILALAIAAISYFGFLSPQAATGQSCFINQVFLCNNARLSENGLLTISIQQSKFVAVNMTGVGCSSNATNEHMSTFTTANQVILTEGATYNITIRCYGSSGAFAGNLNTLFSGNLYLNYLDTTTGFAYSTTGRVLSKVSFVSSVSTTFATTTIV